LTELASSIGYSQDWEGPASSVPVWRSFFRIASPCRTRPSGDG